MTTIIFNGFIQIGQCFLKPPQFIKDPRPYYQLLYIIRVHLEVARKIFQTKFKLALVGISFCTRDESLMKIRGEFKRFLTVLDGQFELPGA